MIDLYSFMGAKGTMKSKKHIRNIYSKNVNNQTRVNRKIKH